MFLILRLKQRFERPRRFVFIHDRQRITYPPALTHHDKMFFHKDNKIKIQLISKFFSVSPKFSHGPKVGDR